VLPTLDGDAKRIHGGLSWFGQKKSLRPAGKGEYCISLHLSACVGVTSRERGNRSQVSKKEYNGVLLEMLISKVGKMSVLFFRCPSFSLESALPSPFIDSREGQGLQQTLGGALEEKAERALSVLLWRRAPVCAGHLWDVVVMLMTGRRDIWGAAEYVRFPMVDVRVVVPLFD
jgi:hypothetical protein